MARQQTSQMTLRGFCLWLALGLFLNFIALQVDPSTFDTVISSLPALNLFHLFAFFVVFTTLEKTRTAARITRRDLIFGAVLAVACATESLVGPRTPFGLIVMFAGLWMLYRDRTDHSIMMAGAMLIAISVHIFWARLFFVFFIPELLSLDAAAVGLVAPLFQPGVQMSGTAFSGLGDHGVTLIGACSTFNNISLAALAGFAAILFGRGSVTLRDWPWFAALTVAMIVINVTRLSLMTSDHDSYVYWHDETGAQIIHLVQTVTIIGICIAAAIRGPRGGASPHRPTGAPA